MRKLKSVNPGGKRYLSEAAVQELTRKQTGNVPQSYSPTVCQCQNRKSYARSTHHHCCRGRGASEPGYAFPNFTSMSQGVADGGHAVHAMG